MKKCFILALFFAAMLGCTDDEDASSPMIMITDIQDEYDGQRCKARIGEYNKVAATGGYSDKHYVKKGKVKFHIETHSERYGYSIWGNGSYPIILLLDNNTFIYTKGKTFEELEIDICSIDVIYNFSMELEDFQKLPKFKFPAPNRSAHEIILPIEFNQFQKIMCD